MQKRIQAFKDKNWQEYGQCIQAAAQAMTQITAEMTQKSCEHKGYGQEQFKSMMQKTFSDQAYSKKLEEFKAKLAQQLDGDMSNGFPETREEVKKVYLAKTNLEG